MYFAIAHYVDYFDTNFPDQMQNYWHIIPIQWIPPTYDYLQLKGILDNSTYDKHSGTKFQCLGHALDYKLYRELDWAAQLFYSIKDHMTNNILQFIHHTNIRIVFQQLY